MALIRDRTYMQDGEKVPIELLISCIKEHQESMSRLNKLDQYYRGKHAILQRLESATGLPNNKLVANHAKYITDIAVGYVLGNAVKYEGNQIKPITEHYKQVDISSHDAEIGKDLSTFGHGLELYYFSGEQAVPKVTCIDPRKIFLVVDDTVEYQPMFAVHYYPKIDLSGVEIGWKIFVYTATTTNEYFTENLTAGYEMISSHPHYWGAVPVVEFWNNEEQMGDFEGVLTLIDAYNTLASDRVNDKEQLVDAILMIKGISLGDDVEEASQTIQLLKKLKVLELPDQNADADWLVKQLNETEVEVLRKAIKSDIHEFSMVPDLTDENFAANASGVAMKYKLFGLEQLAVTKERYFKQGLRERLAMFARAFDLKGQYVEVADVQITMTRNLPANDVETANMINLLDNKVSDETLISQLSFVEDSTEEIERVNKQKYEDIKLQRSAFEMPNVDSVVDDDEESDE